MLLSVYATFVAMCLASVLISFGELGAVGRARGKRHRLFFSPRPISSTTLSLPVTISSFGTPAGVGGRGLSASFVTRQNSRTFCKLFLDTREKNLYKLLQDFCRFLCSTLLRRRNSRGRGDPRSSIRFVILTQKEVRGFSLPRESTRTRLGCARGIGNSWKDFWVEATSAEKARR